MADTVALQVVVELVDGDVVGHGDSWSCWYGVNPHAPRST
jgi:hypothetical protein